jgi:hypothetical protein
LGGKTNIPIPIKKTKSERREHTQAETVGNFNRGAAAAAACIIVISEECFFFPFFLYWKENCLLPVFLT